MIARTFARATFTDLAAYLVRGRDGNNPGRVAWTASRHVPTRNPDRAAMYMEATARLSRRVRYPCYHVVLAWDPSDQPDRERMEGVVDHILAALKLAEHQALLVSHNDTRHPHVHTMLNRVHPKTGKAWDRWYDRLGIEKILRQQERELGFREVPGRLARLPDQERPLPRSYDWSASRDSAGMTLLERARATVPDIRRIRSWGDLDACLAAAGLVVVRQGRGLVVSDGITRVSTARVHPELALVALERRFDDRFPDPVPAPDLMELVRHLGVVSREHELRAAVAQAQNAVSQVRSRRDLSPMDRQRAEASAGDVLSRAERELAAHRRAFGSTDDLEQMIGLTMVRLVPKEIATLQRLVSPPDLALAMQLKAQARELLIDRDQQRNR